VSESITPVALPQEYRKLEPERHPTVADLGLGKKVALPPEALYIDQDWGLWVIPSFELATIKPSSEKPIVVGRKAEGLVMMIEPYNMMKESFEKSLPLPAYKSFLPITKIVNKL
jgi:hypothetical protein